MRLLLPGLTLWCIILLQFSSVARAQSSKLDPVSAAQAGPPGRSLSSNDALERRPTVALTLTDAETRALRNQPRIQAAQLRTQAAGREISAYRSGYFPQAYGNVTAVEANGDTAVAAGALTTSSISTRTAAGASLLQMITDFGHTSNLVHAARFQGKATAQNEETTRQAILSAVQSAYFVTEAAQSVRQTAQSVLDYRRLTLNQLSALAQSQLRSTLDVQFAQVLVSEAELAVVRAQTNVEKAQAQLTAAMGEEQAVNFTLQDEPLPAVPDPDPANYVAEAIADRPDLKALHLHSQSEMSQARAERDLNYPTLNALATGGEVPIHDSTIHREYGAVGVNLNIPIFNGRQYSERAAADNLEARAADKDASSLEVNIVRDVRMTWADARDAYLQIAVTQRLLEEANVAMRLAQARYDAGLGSIVELNQAQLNQTSALIGAATAKFDYQRAMSAFHFTLGDLH
ncbi:MAG TPA: TolC family protein [Acidobacteriaceae bacterium]|nr:TolC family protein [Acidobacteriaceae bacterium]